MNERVAGFVQSRSIAVVGVSSSRMKFGSIAYKTLKKNGYNVYAVNPSLETFQGDKCYRNLAEVPSGVEAAVVAIKPASAADLVERAVQAGIKRIWFQQGADYTPLAERATLRGLDVVTDKCVLMYAEPVSGIHRIHRFFAKLFKKY